MSLQRTIAAACLALPLLLAPCTASDKPRPRVVTDDAAACETGSVDALRSGKRRANLEALPEKPAKGKSYRDPDHGTCVVRLTDHAQEPPEGFVRNLYSRIQPFNADESRVLVLAEDGYWHLYDADTLEHVKQLSLGGGSVEPQWHPTDPDTLYLLPNKGGLVMYTYDVEREERREIVDFRKLEGGIEGHPDADGVLDLWPDAKRIWTRWEGSPSMDARYWAFQVENDHEQALGLITFDLKEQRITGAYDIRGVGRPDHVSMSPKGNYAVVSWPRDAAECPLFRSMGTLKKPCGLMAFSRDFTRATPLAPTGPHSDLAIDASGREVIVISNYDSGDVEMIDLASGKVTPLWRIYVDGASTAMHVSGKAYRKPGWVLVSTYWARDPKNAKPWYENRLMAVELKENPRILNIATIVSKVRSYFSEPHAAVNRDFTRVVFNANWGSGKDEDVDVYIARLSAGAVPAIGSGKTGFGSSQ